MFRKIKIALITIISVTLIPLFYWALKSSIEFCKNVSLHNELSSTVYSEEEYEVLLCRSSAKMTIFVVLFFVLVNFLLILLHKGTFSLIRKKIYKFKEQILSMCHLLFFMIIIALEPIVKLGGTIFLIMGWSVTYSMVITVITFVGLIKDYRRASKRKISKFSEKKMMVLLSNGFEEVEAVAPVDILKRAGVAVDIYSTTRHDILRGAHNIDFIADKILPENMKNFDYDVISDKYDGVILPGGLPNAHNLRDDERVNEIVMAFYNKSKVIAAICASPCTFEKLGLLEGKKATSYPGCINPESCGEYTQDAAVRDGNIVTGRSAGAALDFGFEILKALGLEKEADTVKSQIIY